MKLKGGIESIIVTAADFEMISMSNTRIILPYHGEVLGELLTAVSDELMWQYAEQHPEIYDEETETYIHILDFDELVSCYTAEVFFNVRTNKVLTFLHIHTALTFLEGVLDYNYSLDMEPQEITAVLDAYFADGGKGLMANYPDWYFEHYQDWKEKLHKNFSQTA